MNPTVYKVAVEAPLKEALTYLPPESQIPLTRGQSVTVPLGKRKIHGVVTGTTEMLPDPSTDGGTKIKFKLKPIFDFEEERPALQESFLQWTEWLGRYYFYPHGKVLESVFPPLKRFSNRKRKGDVIPLQAADACPELTDEQKSCLASIEACKGFGVHLLFGVTGSGKTEVYLNLIKDTLAQGKQALVLVPEISLTPQLLDRFSKRFPDQCAVIHSHLTEREKTDQWWNIVSQEKKILIGARSAMFCPIPKLGLIIVDEEHEPSYKQEEKLKYHGRDAAVMLARYTNCPIILGSATPSLESWNNVLEKRYELHEMKNRVANRSMPIIEVLDMKEERKERREQITDLPFWMSVRLFEAMFETLEKGEQVALFLNRRGTAQMAHCSACAHVVECPNCAVSLTVHVRDHMVCHYCGYTEVKPKMCPECGQDELKPLGMGTESLEDDLRKIFPSARLARADRDEIQSRAELEDMITKVENRDIDILIGTQMIAKGLDFPHLTLVGLVMADIGFHWPDFRAAERSFQLLTQVSGRSGRHSKDPGRVIIQTYSPTHPSIVHTVANSFKEFAENELQERNITAYPPFQRLALLRINGTDPQKTKSTAASLAQRATALASAQEKFKDVRVLGPAPSPIAKLRGRFRHQILIKAPDSNTLRSFCAWTLQDDTWIPAGTKVQVDVDPLHML
jgi:primosomal protein N' (replication factor Y) (superfamily II helicase)